MPFPSSHDWEVWLPGTQGIEPRYSWLQAHALWPALGWILTGDNKDVTEGRQLALNNLSGELCLGRAFGRVSGPHFVGPNVWVFLVQKSGFTLEYQPLWTHLRRDGKLEGQLLLLLLLKWELELSNNGDTQVWYTRHRKESWRLAGAGVGAVMPDQARTLVSFLFLRMRIKYMQENWG